MDTQKKDLIKYFKYLDDLQEQAVVNMFAAEPYLISAFGINKHLAKNVCSAWRGTYSDVAITERADKALKGVYL